MHSIYLSISKIVFLVITAVASFYSASFLTSLELSKKDIDEARNGRPEISIEINGTNRRYGNIVAFQTFLIPINFATTEIYYETLKHYLKKAQDNGFLDSKTLVVFPEHIGSGLVYLNEKRPAFKANSISQSFRYIGFYNYNEYSEFAKKSESENKEIQAIFNLKAESMAKNYQMVFSKLAKEFAVTILAGSIILPNPEIKNNQLEISTGDLYNTSVVFMSNGELAPILVKKISLNSIESKFIKKGDINQERILSVPGWKIAIMIGEDSLFKENYTEINSKQVDAIINPSFSINPIEMPTSDEQKILQSYESKETNDIWFYNGANEKIKNTKAIEAIQVFFRGEIFDFDLNGLSYTNRESKYINRVKEDQKAVLLNLYF
jgi:predicted amidohydrolase